MTMGKVLVTAKIESLGDLQLVHSGHLSSDQVRKIEVNDALVDTGATNLSMPKSMIAQLGLMPFCERTMRTTTGVVKVQIYAGVRLAVQGRECVSDVAEVPDGCPVLIGQVPLEMLDFVVDPKGQKLIGNPEHGGEQMIEMWSWFDHP
jgi:predicted aspartyl protease